MRKTHNFLKFCKNSGKKKKKKYSLFVIRLKVEQGPRVKLTLLTYRKWLCEDCENDI